jgi:death-on-curing protein
VSAAGAEAYPTLPAKAAALAFSLIKNHPFVDGNKRVGHAAMATFLFLNGWELEAPIVEAERVILDVASGFLGREALTEWISSHLVRH